jgi:hypothetical protein
MGLYGIEVGETIKQRCITIEAFEDPLTTIEANHKPFTVVNLYGASSLTARVFFTIAYAVIRILTLSQGW